MTQIIDYSWARPDPKAIVAAGYPGVIRYLSKDPSKNLTPAERDALFAEDLDILLVWETTGDTTGGSDVGKAHAIEANKQADALGYPRDVPIFYASDHDYLPDQVIGYYQGVAAAGGRPWGLYGGIKLVDGITAPYYWQAAGWSGGNISTRAHLHQFVSGSKIPGTDVNAVLNPVPMWSKAPAKARPVSKSVGPRLLRAGVSGQDVKTLQLMLNRVFPLYSHLVVDGVFGPLTEAVVKEFQMRAHIAVDGIVGPQTRKALAVYGIWL